MCEINQKKLYKKLGTFFLFVSILTISLSIPKKTEAIPVFDATDYRTDVKTAFESTVSAVSDVGTSLGIEALVSKEYAFDGIIFALKRGILMGIQRSTLNWINSGFEGSPAFVTDFNQFLLDTADEVAGEMIYGSRLNYLCSPFQLDVKIALALKYQQQRDYVPQCTLTGVVDNIDDFFQDGFAAGGYPAWFEITQNPINTPMGAFLEADGLLRAEIETAQTRETIPLISNDFWHSISECETVEKMDGRVTKENCVTTVPGKVISERINSTLGYGDEVLISANEINEVIGALFAQLGQQAIAGAGGLLGLGEGSRYSNYSFGSNKSMSFLQAMQEDEQNTVQETSSSGRSPIEEGIRSTTEYIGKQKDIIARVSDVIALLTAFKDEFTITDPDTKETVVTCVFQSIPSSLISKKTAAESEILKIQSSLDTLIILDEEYKKATSPNTQLEIFSAYTKLEADGLVKSDVEIARVDFDTEIRLIPDIDTYVQTLNTQAQQCTERNSRSSSSGGGNGNGGR